MTVRAEALSKCKREACVKVRVADDKPLIPPVAIVSLNSTSMTISPGDSRRWAGTAFNDRKNARTLLQYSCAVQQQSGLSRVEQTRGSRPQPRGRPKMRSISYTIARLSKLRGSHGQTHVPDHVLADIGPFGADPGGLEALAHIPARLQPNPHLSSSFMDVPRLPASTIMALDGHDWQTTTALRFCSLNRPGATMPTPASIGLSLATPGAIGEKPHRSAR